MTYPAQKWKVKPDEAEDIKKQLVKKGGIEDKEIKSEHEIWRIKIFGATLTYYASGTLYCTPSRDPRIRNVHDFIYRKVGSIFVRPSREILIGLDEVGKGEILGHEVLAGIMFPSNLYGELERLASVTDTKKRKTIAYWDEVMRKIDNFRDRGLDFQIQKIPPWIVDRFNLNKIMDVVYQRILLTFVKDIEPSRCRIVVDDYGVGKTLLTYLKSLENQGAEIVVTTEADNKYLEARVASLIAKREREKVIEAINKKFKINGEGVGTGNARDAQTIKWLKLWKQGGKEWPWFVKRSYKTVRELDGLPKYKKITPPINEAILSKEFIDEFKAGRYSIETLAVVCPYCGERSKAVLMTIDKINGKVKTMGRCIKCKNSIPDLEFTLRYYCGYLMPDTSIISGGFLGKDLSQSKFFENFTIIINPIVKSEADMHKGSRKELGRLGEFAAIGRIRLEIMESNLDETQIKNMSKLERDTRIIDWAKKKNAILITADNPMKAS